MRSARCRLRLYPPLLRGLNCNGRKRSAGRGRTGLGGLSGRCIGGLCLRFRAEIDRESDVTYSTKTERPCNSSSRNDHRLAPRIPKPTSSAATLGSLAQQSSTCIGGHLRRRQSRNGETLLLCFSCTKHSRAKLHARCFFRIAERTVRELVARSGIYLIKWFYAVDIAAVA